MRAMSFQALPLTSQHTIKQEKMNAQEGVQVYEKSASNDYQSHAFAKRPSTSYRVDGKSQVSSEVVTPVGLKEAGKTSPQHEDERIKGDNAGSLETIGNSVEGQERASSPTASPGAQKSSQKS